MKYHPMKWTLPVFLFVSLTALSSCEGFSCAEGVILDANTGLPIDSVHVDVLSGGSDEYTDSTGRFRACNGMGGCNFGCKDIVVKLCKAGYDTIVLTEPRDSIFHLTPQ